MGVHCENGSWSFPDASLYVAACGLPTTCLKILAKMDFGPGSATLDLHTQSSVHEANDSLCLSAPSAGAAAD